MKKRFNVFDGLYHNPDGSTTFTPEGQVVGGVNNYHQSRNIDNEDELEAVHRARDAEIRSISASAR